MTKEEFLSVAKDTGVEIQAVDGRVTWTGEHAGKPKPVGPLVGKRIGAIVASEFSDFQAYYLAEYVSELGGSCTFIGVEKPRWKHTRPAIPTKGVQGMWGVRLDPIPVLGRRRSDYVPLSDTNVDDFDAVVVLGGHSADLVQTEKPAIALINEVHAAGGVIGAIGDGSLGLLRTGLLNGRRATGNQLVSYLIERLGTFEDRSVSSDDRLVTARDSVDIPAFLREIARHFTPEYQDRRGGTLNGKRIVMIAGEEFEDIELVTPFLEFLHRGAEVTFGTFPPPLRTRPPMLSETAIMGSFGVSVPLQEVADELYSVRQLADIAPEDFDIAMIPGAFCPWNMVAARAPLEWLKKVSGAGKPLAAICHGAIPLCAANLVEGKHIAGVTSCKEHIETMGGTHDNGWSAVVDGQIITGRVPFDLPEFVDAISYAALNA